MREMLLVVLCLLVPESAVEAQWPAFPTAGAPRLASGKPDLSGPAPKTAEGKPDFSGVWESVSALGGRSGAPAGNGIPRGGFQNLGVNFPGGLLPYQPGALELRNKRLARNSADHPDAHCLPLHPVQLWFHPQPRKIIQTRGEIVFLAEANGGVRQIFLDGRQLPARDSVLPWWYGYSVGKWEGDTLVIESAGFLDDSWIDENGSPMSGEGRVTERIRRPNFGTLEVEITVNDLKTYTKPFTVSAPQKLMADDELIEFVCGENNTSVKHLPGYR